MRDFLVQSKLATVNVQVPVRWLEVLECIETRARDDGVSKMTISEVEAVAARYGLGEDMQNGSKITLAQENKEMLRYVLLWNTCC